MGTWDIGPFDNDTAADFAGDLDEAPREEREAIIRKALVRAIGTAGSAGTAGTTGTTGTEEYLDQDVAVEAVAAAALVAAQCPGASP